MPRRARLNVPGKMSKSPRAGLSQRTGEKKTAEEIPASVVHRKDFVKSAHRGRKRMGAKRAFFLPIGRRSATASNSRPVPLHGAPQSLAEVDNRLIAEQFPGQPDVGQRITNVPCAPLRICR